MRSREFYIFGFVLSRFHRHLLFSLSNMHIKGRILMKTLQLYYFIFLLQKNAHQVFVWILVHVNQIVKEPCAGKEIDVVSPTDICYLITGEQDEYKSFYNPECPTRPRLSPEIEYPRAIEETRRNLVSRLFTVLYVEELYDCDNIIYGNNYDTIHISMRTNLMYVWALWKNRLVMWTMSSHYVFSRVYRIPEYQDGGQVHAQELTLSCYFLPRPSCRAKTWPPSWFSGFGWTKEDK